MIICAVPNRAMDDDLKQYLDGMEQRITRRIDTAATQLETTLDRFETTEQRLTGRLDQRLETFEQRLADCMQEVQTELLKAFRQTYEQGRMRDLALEARATGVENRLNGVERRLSEIEKKLFLDPPAA